MYKEDYQVVKIGGINYLRNKDYTLTEYKPWLTIELVWLYDIVMRLIVFPWKLKASLPRHKEILRQQLKEIHNKHVLELAVGTGYTANVLPFDNMYKGTDICKNFLKIALKTFKAKCFKQPELYLVAPDDLPFVDGTFSVCLCILALNFFEDTDKVVKEIKRVLAPGGLFIGCVPVQGRGNIRGKYVGTLLTEEYLKELFENNGLTYTFLSVTNGPILYFKASLEGEEVGE